MIYHFSEFGNKRGICGVPARSCLLQNLNLWFHLLSQRGRETHHNDYYYHFYCRYN